MISHHSTSNTSAGTEPLKMKNKALSLTAGSVPYIKELRSIAGSIAACIVMQQLDFWFARHAGGFYKFLEAAENHEAYRVGDSWCEELGVTADEFRTAFDKLAVRYTSRTAFEAARDAGDVFAGRYYCSFFDKRRGLTYYLRNHEVVDAALDRLFASTPPPMSRPPVPPVTGNFHLQGSGGAGPFGSWQIPSTETESSRPVEMAESISVTAPRHPDYKDAQTTPETTHIPAAQITTTATPAPLPQHSVPRTRSVVACNKYESPLGTSESDAIRAQVVTELNEAESPVVADEGMARMVALLVAQGVSAKVAGDLAAEPVTAARVETEVAYLPYRKADEPVKILVAAIKHGEYGIPPAYTAARQSVEKQRQMESDRAAESARAAADVEAIRLEKAVRLAAAEQAEAAQAAQAMELNAMLSRLTAMQRDRLEVTAWEEVARIKGPAGTKAARVAGGILSSKDALASNITKVAYERVLRHLVAEAAAKGIGR